MHATTERRRSVRWDRRDTLNAIVNEVFWGVDVLVAADAISHSVKTPSTIITCRRDA